eukprot:scaffold2748_cov193-Alexandrium_tamarense.AAC.34
MKISPILSSIALAIITSTSAQEQYTDYQDYADGYEQDNLYENYAMQHDKAAGGGGCSSVISGDLWHSLNSQRPVH